MALILALNPGNRHSPTLSRLARELLGCELIGADSCDVALRAINERLPDVILLPAKSARGEADLLTHLKSVPGGVPTLRLPPVESADPAELAKQIRRMLTGTSIAEGLAPPSRGASPHMLAAATAAINWVHKRREQWAAERPDDTPREPVPQWSGVSPSAADIRRGPIEPYEADHTSEASRSEGPNADAPPGHAWLPRVAALAVVIGILGGMVACWPQIRGTFSSTGGQPSVTGPPSSPAVATPSQVVQLEADFSKP